MSKIDEAIKDGCKNCSKAANEVPCMWGGFVGDCPYNTYKSEPEPTEFTKNFRERLTGNATNYIHSQTQDFGIEACKIIDRLTAELAEARKKPEPEPVDRTPLSELWVCGDCKWYGTADARGEDGCCPQCTDDDLMRLDSIVEVMHVCGSEDEIDRLVADRDAHSKIRQRHLVRCGKQSARIEKLRAELKAKDKRIVEAQKQLNCVGENLEEKLVRYCVTKAKQALKE